VERGAPSLYAYDHEFRRMKLRISKRTPSRRKISLSKSRLLLDLRKTILISHEGKGKKISSGIQPLEQKGRKF